MILAVDIGNTYIVLGAVDGQCKVVQTVQMKTDPNETAYEYAVRMKQILSLTGIEPGCFDGAIVSSEVPWLTVVLLKAVRLVTGHDAVLVGAGVKTGLNIRLDDPGTITGNLVAAAVAVKEEYPLPAFIFDMGTATSVVAVDRSGNYLGGAIMPGVGLSMDALTKGTSLLPSIDFDVPKKIIGTNTVDAMKSGIVYGSAGAVDGIIDRFREELGNPETIIATGSMGRLVAPHCRHSIVIDNRLVMKGLGYIYYKNLESRQKTSRRKKS